MAIERDGNLYDVECTECSEIESFEAADWDELMRKMKEKGWTKEKVDGEWEHYCPDCTEENADDDDDDDDDEEEEDDE